MLTNTFPHCPRELHSVLQTELSAIVQGALVTLLLVIEIVNGVYNGSSCSQIKHHPREIRNTSWLASLLSCGNMMECFRNPVGEDIVIDIAINNVCGDAEYKQITVIDGGGNLGDYSKLVVSVYDKLECELPLRVVAVEPVPVTAAKMRINLHNDDRVTVIEAALSDTDEVGQIAFDGPGDWGASLSDKHSNSANAIDVQIRKLDTVVKELKLHSIALVKLDLESFEFKAIHGMAGMLKQTLVPMIQWERNGYWVLNHAVNASVKEEVDYVSSFGYAVFVVGKRFIRVDGAFWNPIVDAGFKGGMDTDWTLNFVAVAQTSKAFTDALAVQIPM